jgi:hypothetical protein
MNHLSSRVKFYMTIIINFSVERPTQLLPSHGAAKLAIIMLGYLCPARARTSVLKGALATTFYVLEPVPLGLDERKHIWRRNRGAIISCGW